jgi:uncharacterized RmlC-like cupin family protein
MTTSDEQPAGMRLDVRVVRPDERDSRTAQTPGGLHRFEAVSGRLTGSQRMWMGFAVLEPGGSTGVHHHGESETAIYVLSGVARWWVGDRLDDVREAHAGDFVFIPPNVVHWEQNASRTAPVEMIVARSTQQAIVVPMDDHPYAPDHVR